jgi:UDP-glucose 4-epimerase
MILVTGALGYIGSHIAVELASSSNEELLLIDCSCHESEHTLDVIQTLSQKPCAFVQLDLRSEKDLKQLFESYPQIDIVVHCAAKKSVFESIKEPLTYYDHNLVGSFHLLNAMQKANVHQLIFSSTAAIYADAGAVAYNETMPLAFHTTYGNTKLMFEIMLSDYCKANPNFSAISLRYFNVTGAHPSGLLGELLNKSSGNLFPEILKATLGQIDHLTIYGNDYPTADGTAIRDYIHVMDIAQGHIDAIQYLKHQPCFQQINLGRGQGYSVLEVVNAFEKETGIAIPYEFKPRRTGDLCSVVADTKKAKILPWSAKYDIEKMVEDAWRYAQLTTQEQKKMAPR